MRRVKKVTYYGYTELINANYAVEKNALATGLVNYHLYILKEKRNATNTLSHCNHTI